jgi:hypothetical protein
MPDDVIVSAVPLLSIDDFSSTSSESEGEENNADCQPPVVVPSPLAKIPLDILTDHVWPCLERWQIFAVLPTVNRAWHSAVADRPISHSWDTTHQRLLSALECAPLMALRGVASLTVCVNSRAMRHQRLEWQRLELVTRMPSMRSLNVSHCGLRHAVGDLVPMPLQLVNLDLSWNVRTECVRCLDFEFISHAFYITTVLADLFLNSSQHIGSAIASLEFPPSLRSLHLAGNDLSGSCLLDMAPLLPTDLQVLDVSNNALATEAASFFIAVAHRASHIVRLSVVSNGIGASQVDSICALGRDRPLFPSMNEFCGSGNEISAPELDRLDTALRPRLA